MNRIRVENIQPEQLIALLGKSPSFYHENQETGEVKVGIIPRKRIEIRNQSLNTLNAEDRPVIGLLNYEYSYRHLDKNADTGVHFFFTFDHYLTLNDGVATIESYAEGVEEIVKALQSPNLVTSPKQSHQLNPCDTHFFPGLKRIHQEINNGNLFQCVLSVPFSAPSQYSAVEALIRLRNGDQTPYLYYFSDGERQVVGQSPETLVRSEKSDCFTYPIAGTRGRGKTSEREVEIEQELVNCPKERAEHLMLVDLARNDLNRTCKQVEVTQYCEVKKFSRVMHLISEVKGTLRDGQTALDALEMCFPAGTLTGAPKIQAIKTIQELESRPRGAYGGAFIISKPDQLDSCIVIRSASFQDGITKIQAGAGIVFDSVDKNEYKEILRKTQVLRECL